MIKYLGSKRLLVPQIVEAVGGLEGVESVVDLFSGTSRVGMGLKAAGYRVFANDNLAYAATLARAYIEADDSRTPEVTALVAELNQLPPKPGYFTQTYCEDSHFFQPKNGARVDAIREEIRRKSLDPELEAVLLVALMEAADRVDSTTGLHMAYLKQWAPRSFADLTLRVPDLLPQAAAGKGKAYQGDASEAAELEADVAYLDPPYNQHRYLSNYHIWETLVRWDAPEVYGKARKRVDCKTRKSPFNGRRSMAGAFADLIRRVRARYLLVSFNNEGYISRAEMEAVLSTRGEVTVLAHDFRRYVGARIGIYNPKGEKVGRVSHTTNTEYLYVVRPGEMR